MKRISTLAELKEEQRFLQMQKTFLEAEIKKEFAELKQEFEPLQIVTKSAGKLLSSDDNKMLARSFGHLAEFLTKNVFLKKSGFISRLIVPFLVKNTASNLVEDHKSQLADWIMKGVAKFSNKKPAQA